MWCALFWGKRLRSILIITSEVAVENKSHVFVSIIIPFFNREEELNSLINTIPDIPDVEVVMVDDHSTESVSIDKVFKSAGVLMIKNRNGARYAGTARNEGIRRSSGEYILFADSDDLIVAHGLLASLTILKKKRPDILFCRADSFLENGSKGVRHIKYNWLVDQAASSGSTDILVRHVSPWCKFIRKAFITGNNIKFESQRVSNDIFFSGSLIVHNPDVLLCDQVVYSIREGNPSLTSDYTASSLLMRLDALERYNRLLSSNGLGYLMSPAFPFLVKVVRSGGLLLGFRRVFRVAGQRQPIFITLWSLGNLVRRFVRAGQ